MAATTTLTNHLSRMALAVGLAMPGLAMAHGSDHLHFWGSHSAEGQIIPLALSLLALAGLGWWLWRSRG